MIHIKYQKKGNYPHDRKIILFDRDAFQSLGDEGLRKVNEKYNILCPQVFVIECLAPNKASEKQKRWLRRRLALMENSIVLTGNTHVSPLIDIPYNVEYSGILAAEQIARNCITSIPITMERVTPERLISYYEPRISAFKKEMKAYTEICDSYRASLTMNRLISETQRGIQRTNNRVPSRQEIRDELRENERTRITQEPNYAAEEALREIESKSVEENIEGLKTFLFLTDKDTRGLRDQIQEGNRKTLTIENYPDLAYPIYIYYLFFYMICARQHDTQHLDQSYVRDFRYLHYLNFCDRFITKEKSTPHIVKAIPYRHITDTPISSLEKLKRELN